MISRAIRGALSPFQKSGFFAPLSRHYRKREGIKKEKEKKFGKILADDKMIKLSRKDNEDERLRLEVSSTNNLSLRKSLKPGEKRDLN